MKILIILTGGLKKDGITLGNISYFEAMDKEDIEIDFLANNDVDKTILRKINEINCNIINIFSRKGNPVKYFFQLKKIIKNNGYNIVHVHGSSSLMLLEMYAAKLGGVPVRIAHSRNTCCNYKFLDKLFRKLFYKYTTDFFACGKDAGEWLFENRSFTIIPNGKDIKKFGFSNIKRFEVRKKYNLEDKFVICHIGSFNNQKNHNFLIDIFYEINQINKETCLILIGDGELKADIIKKINELKLSNYVILTGSINNINEILQGVDYMILPSRFEGLPNVVIESQIAGVHSIVSDNITRECKITNLVEFESLNSECKIWADRVLNTTTIDRESCKDEIINQVRQAGYDIEINSKKLKDLYLSLYNENNRKRNYYL